MSVPLRIAFAGTPVFAARALEALVAAKQRPVLVLSQPDRPAGRGRSVQPTPVKALAQAHGIDCWQPASLRDAAAAERLRDASLDLMVVAAYGALLPQAVLDVPRLGCVNIHASLLPRWRGAAPIQRAIEAGDAETGITIMQMEAGLDTGPMLLVRRTPIRPDDTGGSLHDRLAELGAQAIVEAVEALAAGGLPAVEQPEQGVTYARKLGAADARLDFGLPATALVDRIRAFDPVPGSQAMLDRPEAVMLKIWRAELATGGVAGHVGPTETVPFGTAPTAAAGTVLAADSGALVVACADGAVRVQVLQRPGGRRLDWPDFVRGYPIAVGERFLPPVAT